MTLSQIYAALQTLSPQERLRLATLLLQSIGPEMVVDDDEQWSEADVREYAAHCREKYLKHPDSET